MYIDFPNIRKRRTSAFLFKEDRRRILRVLRISRCVQISVWWGMVSLVLPAAPLLPHQPPAPLPSASSQSSSSPQPWLSDRCQLSFRESPRSGVTGSCTEHMGIGTLDRKDHNSITDGRLQGSILTKLQGGSRLLATLLASISEVRVAKLLPSPSPPLPIHILHGSGRPLASCPRLRVSMSPGLGTGAGSWCDDDAG